MRPAHAQTPPGSIAWIFLSQPEAEFLTAAVDRLIPPDEAPGGAEAGCVTFIDRQLAGGFGTNRFTGGPFQDDTPEQGHQLGLRPGELYRHAIAAADRQEGRLHDMDADAQDDLLRRLGDGIDLDRVPSEVFFETLLKNTMEGYLADPFCGGNAGMAGWRLARLPDARGQWRDLVTSYEYEVTEPPVSVFDAGPHDHCVPPHGNRDRSAESGRRDRRTWLDGTYRGTRTLVRGIEGGRARAPWTPADDTRLAG